MIKVLTLVLIALLFIGCVRLEDPMPLTVPQMNVVKMNVVKIEIIDKSYYDTNKGGYFSSSGMRNFHPFFYQTLKENVLGIIQSSIEPSLNGSNKLVVTINRLEAKNTWNSAKAVPIIELFAIGSEETIVAVIEILLEIENSDGQVIASTVITTRGEAKESLSSPENLRAGYSRAMTDAIKSLNIEIVKQSNRVLHTYLIK